MKDGALLTAYGKTVQEAKQDLMQCLEDAKQDAIENGKKVEDVEFIYKYDLETFFDYFSFLNVNDIARRSGINPSLLRQYKGGFKDAGEKTYQKLNKCISEITKELEVATF